MRKFQNVFTSNKVNSFTETLPNGPNPDQEINFIRIPTQQTLGMK